MASRTNLSTAKRSKRKAKKSQKSRKVKFNNGLYGQTLFPSVCHLMGWECSKPFVEQLPYDFVVRGINDKFSSVQIKQCYYDKNKESFRCDIRKKTSGNKKVSYEEGDFDYLAVYNPITDSWYIFPWHEVRHISSEISINESHRKFKINVRIPFSGPNLGTVRSKKN
jgi:hypothetical protein